MAKPPAKSARNGKKAKSIAIAAKPKASNNPPKPVARPVDKKSRQQFDLEAKLLHMIAEEMALEEAELTPLASFKEDLNLDEIDIAELLMQTEAQFGVHPFNESDWDACATVGEFLSLVSKRVDAKRGHKGLKA
ncbi:MAG: phosphopantetheine-binding protein [Terriglobales bacterium]